MALWLRYVLQSVLTVGFGVARHGLDIFRTQRRAFNFCAPFCFA